MTLLPSEALAQLPTQLRADLVGAFEEIIRNYAEGRWEPAELNGGKLCEAAYSVCKGLADGPLPAGASKPGNMVAACKALEQAAAVPRSVRIQVPRMIVALYEIRNNRNVGHVGGDVDPNHMDAVCVLQMSKWIMAELIRVLHQMPADDAAELVDALVEREVPLVWKVDHKKRVLDPDLSMKDKALLLLHATAGPVAEADLVSWVEHSNPSVFRRDILRRAHAAKLIEYDQTARTATISPVGVAYVETRILQTRV